MDSASRTLRRLLLLGVATVLGLFLGEGVVRLLAPQWSDQWKMYRVDRTYARGLRPGVREAVVHGLSHEFAFRFSTNRQGLRMDYDLHLQPAPGRPRALFIGDSFTFGYGVGQTETFTRRLQDRLDGAGVPVEVVNAGFAGGFTIDSQYVFAREVARAWQPATVVVGVCLSNDLPDLEETRWRVAAGRLATVRKRTDWVPGLVRRSGLINLLLRGVVPRLRAAGTRPAAGREIFGPVCDLPIPRPAARAAGGAGEALTPLEARAVDAWSRERRATWIVEAWAAEARAQGQALVLLLIPDADEVQWPSSRERLAYRAEVRALFANAAARAGVRVVDPVDMLRTHWCTAREPVYFAADGHWNAAGHRLVGDWLAETLFGVAPGEPA